MFVLCPSLSNLELRLVALRAKPFLITYNLRLPTYHFLLPPAYNAVRPFPSSNKRGRSNPTFMIERLPMEIKVREVGAVSILEVHGRLTIGEPSEQLYSALQS